MINLNKDTYDFEGKSSETYTSKCEHCGKEIKVATQEDRCPEYETQIYVMCSCGNSVEFLLPVN